MTNNSVNRILFCSMVVLESFYEDFHNQNNNNNRVAQKKRRILKVHAKLGE